DACPAPLPPVASSTAVAATATTASNIACRGSARGERIKPKITGVWDGLDKARRRGDHRGIVGRELERCESRVGEGLTQLAVGGDTAHDRDPGRAHLLCRLSH